jgi:hypothetical protein
MGFELVWRWFFHFKGSWNSSVPFSCLKFFEQCLALRKNDRTLVIDDSRSIHIMKSRSSDICVYVLPQLEATAPAASRVLFCGTFVSGRFRTRACAKDIHTFTGMGNIFIADIYTFYIT